MFNFSSPGTTLLGPNINVIVADSLRVRFPFVQGTMSPGLYRTNLGVLRLFVSSFDTCTGWFAYSREYTLLNRRGIGGSGA